jgi:UDP-glucose 4-epimerase
MNALVTGSQGFIGRHLVRALCEDGRFLNVIGLSRSNDPVGRDEYLRNREICHGEYQCDLSNHVMLSCLLRIFKPDVVFHMAANPVTKASAADPLFNEQVATNVLGTQHLLAACPPGCRFVYASSATVYGDKSRVWPALESSARQATSVYAATKLAGEALVEAYTHLGHVRGLSLRYVANVGPGATHGVLPDLMGKLMGPDEYLEILGDAGGSVKPYMHVSDTVAATVWLALSDERGAVNVAPDDTLSVADLAECMMDAVGKQKPVRWMGEAANWPGDNPVVRVSNRNLKSLGWSPSIPRSADAVIRASKELRSAYL